jgi:hypothetical protein
MEKQTEEWTKDLIIVRDGTVFRVKRRGPGPMIKGAFTTYSHAERFIKSYLNNLIDETVKRKTTEIRKSDKPIKTRMKEYKELCQAIPNYL